MKPQMEYPQHRQSATGARPGYGVGRPITREEAMMIAYRT